ncbi:MAG: HAMP domain-containing protein [Candidatus Binatia bacterium]
MININKLFRRLSIRAKLVVAFCLLGVVPVVVVGGYGAMQSFLLLNDAIQDRLRAGVAMKADEIQRFLRQVKGDVLFLSRFPTLQALINLPPEASAQRKSLLNRLAKEFLAFSQAHQVYYQVRYLDERGQEVVRADYDGVHHYLVPSDRLQAKRERYYFREAMRMPPGQIYVSPMDLNIERGAVEVPHKPVIRYAVALASAKGEPRGIVIINIYASHILGQVLALGREAGDVFLASHDGLYLTRSDWIRASRDPSGSGGAPFLARLSSYSERLQPAHTSTSLRPEKQLLKDFPAGLVATILSAKAGTVVESGLRGRIVAFAPIFPYHDGQAEFWVLVHAYRKAAVLASSRSLQVLVLVLGGGVLIIALGVGVAAARHFTRPITALIRGAEAIAEGDFDHPIKVETNDELEDLSHQFTRMATHLKEHERQLREVQERAERKAREAEALNRIGMEVLALLSLPQILQLVVDKAREILKGDLAFLCLSDCGQDLRLGAVSGSVGSLQSHPGDLIPALVCEKVASQDARCPAVAGMPLANHVAVAMKSGDRVVGNLCVASCEPRSVGPDELEFLSGLANQATIAIEKARLHREVRDLARLEERERIGQDLHDGIIQSIYAAGLGLEECVRLLDEVPGEVKTRLEQVIEDLNVVIRDVRNYIVGLAPERLQDHDLGQALANLARGLSLNALLDLDLSVEPGIDGTLGPEQTSHLFHICREALTNVVKHAQASRVALTIKQEKGVLLLTVKDDGLGFDAGHRSGGGQGLHNISERARRLGGLLRIESGPGLGTRIAVEIPLRVAA